MKYIDYGVHILTCGEFQELVVMGAGTSIDIAVKVSDQLKQRVEGLH